MTDTELSNTSVNKGQQNIYIEEITHTKKNS